MRVASHHRRGLELIRQLEQLRDKLTQKHMAAPLIGASAPPMARPAPRQERGAQTADPSPRRPAPPSPVASGRQRLPARKSLRARGVNNEIAHRRPPRVCAFRQASGNSRGALLMGIARSRVLPDAIAVCLTFLSVVPSVSGLGSRYAARRIKHSFRRDKAP
jgi:hypothetical protein